MSRRLAAALALVAHAACATPYMEPGPEAGPTVRVILHNANAEDPRDGFASTILDVYAVDGTCDASAADMRDAHKGTLDADQREREFRVVAGRQVFFALSYAKHDYSARVPYHAGCRGEFGFLPQAGEDYSLEFHVGHPHCEVELTRAGEVVPLLHPSECFASGF